MSHTDQGAGIPRERPVARPRIRPLHQVYRPERADGPRDAAAGPAELNGSFLRCGEPPAAEQELVRLRRRARHRLPREVVALQATHQGAPMSAPRPELILDASNLLPFHFLRTGDRVGRAVVKIERADRAAGTAFLVAPDVLLTNHHVLPDAATAAGAVALANYEAEPPGGADGRPTVVPLDPGRLFVTCEELDFTFCGVHGLGHLGCVALSRDSLDVATAEFVNIIQHPRGRPKEVALQDSQVVRADHVVLRYCCDTEPGSSGSPVFNNRWTLVALHHASVATDEPGARQSPGGPPGARFLNEGIRLPAIALWLESAEANRPEQREQVARLRSIFRGADPQVGYFGALGARLDGRSAVEFVVGTYAGSPGHLDIAFWDLSAPGRPVRDRLAEIGWLMADLRMDVWCLAHAQPEDARALCYHLETNFQLDYAALAAPAGAQPGPAILYRPSRARVDGPRLLGDDGRGPAVLNLRAPGKGGTASVNLVPFGPPSADGPAPLAGLIAAAGRDDEAPGAAADWVLIGPGLRLDEPALAGLGGSSAEFVAAAEGAEGAIVVLGNAGGEPPRPRVGTAIVTPNQASRLDPSSRLTVADDRPMPAPAPGGRRPIAVRLVLEPGRPAPATVVEPATADRPAPTAAAVEGAAAAAIEALSALSEAELERALRDLLAPVIARLVAEAKGLAPPAGGE